MTEPREGEVWRSVNGKEVTVRLVWTRRIPGGSGVRVVQVRGRRVGRSGSPFTVHALEDFVANWTRLTEAT